MKLLIVRLLLLVGILLFAGTGRVVEYAIATFVLDLLTCILVIVYGQTMVNEALKNKEKGGNE